MVKERKPVKAKKVSFVLNSPARRKSSATLGLGPGASNPRASQPSGWRNQDLFPIIAMSFKNSGLRQVVQKYAQVSETVLN